jgi:signal peptidase
VTRVERGARRGRVAAVARVAAALVLTVLAGLVVAALAPQLSGCSAHVVTSGSMAPRVDPGDVVVTRPVTAAELRTGQVLLFADPRRPGGLLLHRLVSFDASGDLVTRGDANQSADSVHVAPSSVRGLALLRVPWVGLPAVWRAEGRPGAIAAVAAVLAGAAVFVSQALTRRGAGSAPAGSSRPPVPPMTAARSTEERRSSATSAGYALPPVPPAVARPAPGPGRSRPGPASFARPRPAAAGDHGGCFDGGRLCGQPRR